jgi:hypothetical protein
VEIDEAVGRERGNVSLREGVIGRGDSDGEGLVGGLAWRIRWEDWRGQLTGRIGGENWWEGWLGGFDGRIGRVNWRGYLAVRTGRFVERIVDNAMRHWHS